MLHYLQIRDFAIIDSVELEFSPGLTVLTGETGAGKSILVDALELLAGARATADVVRSGAECADIAATIDISERGGALRHLLEEQSIANEGELVLRRVIGTDGRSRCWLNGRSVPLQVLRDAAALLFDIHGQHEFQSLVRPATQRILLDGYGRIETLASQVRATHAHWLALLNRSLEVEGAANDHGAKLDLLRHQLQELQVLQLQPGEIDELHTEHVRLTNHGRLLEATRSALDSLYDAEAGNAHGLIARAANALRGVASTDAQLSALPGLLDEAALRVKETAHSLQQYLDDLDVDPQRADAIERRLAAAEELARKHRVEAAALPEKRIALAAELESLEHATINAATLRTQLTAALASYHELARQLSAHRATAARGLAKDITARMQELGMTGGRFLIDVEPADGAEPAAHGLDRVEFRVSTNPGQPPRAVAKIASGGELARLSLAVQVSCADGAVPCMLFDEVDSGIGGAVAEIVGRELRTLGQRAQVLCVTHLPQVAAQGHQQLRVAKLTDGRTTRTQVTALSDAARVEEIARMLGGVEITPRARAHAVEMLRLAAAARDSAAAATATLNAPAPDNTPPPGAPGGSRQRRG